LHLELDMPPPHRAHGLVERGQVGLVCDESGVALAGALLAVVALDELGKRRCLVRPIDQIKRALALAYGDAEIADAVRVQKSLLRIGRLIEDGDLGRAQLRAVLLGLPEVSRDGLSRLAAADDLLKYNPDWQDEDRVPVTQDGAGEWTSDGAGGSGAVLTPISDRHVGVTPAQKAAYVSRHLAAAAAAARALGIPVENILGLSALESDWGRSRFAQDGNNYFGVDWPAPGANGWMEARKASKGGKKARLATFSSVEAGFSSFVTKYHGLSNLSDPEKFATMLQDKYKFGIDKDTGEKLKGYVPDVVGTIKKLRSFVHASSV
jgi:hypothetical protein